jgi:predicted MFS family arabinose efflux permease
LAIPAVLAMMVLFAARHFYPRPRDLDVAPPDLTAGHLPRRFWIYDAAAALIAAGYADFPLVAFHFGKTGLIAPIWIPVLYSLAMAADAMGALLLGRLFDRIGIGAMILATCASALSAPLAFLGDPAAAMTGMVLWGIGMGAQASVMRAAIARLAPASQRGTAYGIFNAAYGPRLVRREQFARRALLGPCRRSPVSPSCCKAPPWRSCGGSYGQRQAGKRLDHDSRKRQPRRRLG